MPVSAVSMSQALFGPESATVAPPGARLAPVPGPGGAGFCDSCRDRHVAGRLTAPEATDPILRPGTGAAAVQPPGTARSGTPRYRSTTSPPLPAERAR